MMTVSKRQLWAVLSDNLDDDEVLHAILGELDGLDIRTIYADTALDALPVDDVADIVNRMLDAQVVGYHLTVWAGPQDEFLVAGYRTDELCVVDMEVMS
jgi:hypothetical protein